MAKTSNLETIIECLLDIELDNHISRMANYTELLSICAKSLEFNQKVAENLITICTKDLTADSKYLSYAISILNSVLEKIKTEKCPGGQYLLPSAVALLNVIKLSKQFKQVRQMALSALHLYPEDILIALTTSYSKDVIAIFDFTHFSSTEKQYDNIDKPITILIRILEILPPESKKLFIKEGLDIWLNSVLPAVTWPRPPLHRSLADNILALELMVDRLVALDYSRNPNWEAILSDICESKRYPRVLKSLVESKSDYWHSLWIIFIKLLKDDITKVRAASGVSPINALLPVVELAFRLEPLNRCRAFECWNVLIDNFSMELNGSETNILNKRLKLLLTPLKLNNAKVKDTVFAKLETHWHLIRKFYCKMDKLTDSVLIPFLNFCFGKPSSSAPVPGQISNEVAWRCAEMLVEIVGHVNCNGCVSVPTLQSRLINTKLLVDHWDTWLHCLMTSIFKLEYKHDACLCLWKGFVSVIGELPDNQIRADLFSSLLTAIMKPVLINNYCSPVVLNLAMSLFADEKSKQLLKTKNKDGPLYSVLEIVLYFHMHKPNKPMQKALKESESVVLLRPLTDFIMEGTGCNTDEVLEWLFAESVADQSRTFIWSALADSFIEIKNNLSPKSLNYIVQWPIRNMNLFTPNDLSASYKWYTLYSFIHPTINDNKVDKIILQLVWEKLNAENIKMDFALSVALALLKQQLISAKSPGFQNEMYLLYSVLKRAESNENDRKLVVNQSANLLDTLTLLMTAIEVSHSKNVTIVKDYVEIVKTLLMLFTGKDKLSKENQTFFDSLLKKTYALFLIEDNAYLKKLLDNVLRIKKSNKVEPITADNQNTNIKDEFPLPNAKANKTKKTTPSIVSTTVENGEEYVVVKSNWKFNPRKLTENQKEKLKKKREDIPALYQDLSQSQDEFKLKSWKTDSQDASTTNTASKSNSKSNDDVTTILKNIPSTDILPNIMENITSQAIVTVEKQDNNTVLAIAPPPSDRDTDKQNNKQPKTPKTPRMALKDRVFRNVRNLIEKSGLQSEDKVVHQTTEDLNKTVNENDLKTPVSKPNDASNAVSSAPPKIASERPSRTIKKPKKFEDTEVFALKKRKRSQGSAQTDSDSSKSQEITEKQPESKDKIESGKRDDVVVETEEKEVGPPEKSKEEQIPPVNDPVTVPEVIPVIEVLSSEPSQIDSNKDLSVKSVETADNLDVVIDENTPKEIPEVNGNNPSQIIEEIATPAKPAKNKDTADHSTVKKKRSRIEKQLLIDMVEGHPLLQSQSEKRVTRKSQPNDHDTVSKRRKSLIEKSHKIKAELINAGIIDEKKKEKKKPEANTEPEQATTTTDSQEKLPDSQDIPTSEDIIESSQDSTLTTISVKSATKKKIPLVALDKKNPLAKYKTTDTQKLLEDFNNDVIPLSDTSSSMDSREDIELPKNKTVEDENPEKDLTENMDTLPIDNSSDVIIVNDDPMTPIMINTESMSQVGKDTQEMAEADTMPMDIETVTVSPEKAKETVITNVITAEETPQIDNDITHVSTLDNTTPMITTAEALTDIITESSNTGSPLKDDDRRKKDFLNDTIEISPIKTMSPIREVESPSPEKSSDFVVITLTTPVNSNGEPINDKCDSPEIFTEEKISPDKRDQSPPRKPVGPANTSPSSSLSLKKNRPQMWSNGRTAQMLGLCVPEKLQTIMSTGRSNTEEPKKSPASTPARRNLRILYNSVNSDENLPVATNQPESESEESENFLKFKRTLPTADCSPSGPILKRKLAELDEATASPASKRKRVSFHDPPVSTTIAVQKYIEPCGIRSPSNSALKRQEKQMRPTTYKKSPKRLDNVFRLETVLNKAIEDFSESIEPTVSNETSLDETPSVEVIKTSELNDTDPICPELKDCNDPIENIAGELSSPTTKDLFLKELEGKIGTVGDLAKMTELEVNRLCIKAPKVKVAKKVLNDYASKKVVATQMCNEITPEVSSISSNDVPMKIAEVKMVDMEVQTNEMPTSSSEMQTEIVPVVTTHAQTETAITTHCSAQTEETGSKSTKDIIASCLKEREDFVDQLVDQLQVQQIADKLPMDACLQLVLHKMTASNSTEVFNDVLWRVSKVSGTEDLQTIQDLILQRFDSKQLILFCSQLLQNIHDKAP